MPPPIIVKAPSTPRMPQTRHPDEATWNRFGHLPPPQPLHPPSSGKRPFSVFPVQQVRPEQRPSEPKEDEQTEDWGVWKAPAQHEDAKRRDEPQPIRLRSRKRSLTRTPSATRPVKAAKRWPEECTRYDLPEARERLVREEARMAAKLLRDKDPWPAESLVYRDKLSHLEKCLSTLPPTALVSNLCKLLAAVQFDPERLTQIEFLKHRHYHMWAISVSGFTGPTAAASSVNNFLYYWAHATTVSGFLGICKMGQLLKSQPEPDYSTYGFFCSATNYAEHLPNIVEKRWVSGKNCCNIIVTGEAVSNASHITVKEGGTIAEQRACKIANVCHNRRESRWCIRPSVSTVQQFWILDDLAVSDE